MKLGAAVINKELVTSNMCLAHAAFLLFQPASVVLTELGIGLSLCLILLVVFLPEQHLGHPSAFEFDKTLGEVRHDFIAMGGVGTVERLGQARVTDPIGKRSAQLALFKANNQFRDGGDTKIEAERDDAMRQAAVEFESLIFFTGVRFFVIAASLPSL